MRVLSAGLVGAAVGWATVAQVSGATAAADAGQPVLDDYGQSPAEITAEVTAAVKATPAVVSATATVQRARQVLLARVAAEKLARAAYDAAVRSGVASTITKARARLVAAHTATVAAKASYASARTALARLVTATTTTVRSRHFQAHDGVWTGDVAQYFIPGIGLEPVQVRITVYRGHVSDVSVPQYVSTGESGPYNERAIPVLMQETMAAHDHAAVAVVSGASLTSGAFATSLASALSKAGFPR